MVAHIFATERLQIMIRRDVFQAIADPTRRAILALLALQAMTPNALAEHFDSSRQAISKHIQILTECQLLSQKQTGREIHYHFNPEKMKEADIWMEQFRALWEKRFDTLDEILKNHQNKQS
ncbi:MAG: transcriptional regulator [Mucilaginibacter sp.]|nr:transcriptional regulator [Mucilaginibacter sp.]